jgi:hypothetical protein
MNSNAKRTAEWKDSELVVVDHLWVSYIVNASNKQHSSPSQYSIYNPEV